METLAYIHLAATYEDSESTELAVEPVELSCLKIFSGKKLPSSAWLPLGVLFVSLAIFGFDNASLARGNLLLARGERGAQVTALQQNLREVGVYEGPVTGYYGSLTAAAVREFQLARGLQVDGVAGPNTLTALGLAADGTSILPTDVVLQFGSSGPAVTQLQNALDAVGFYEGPVTGYYGQITEAYVSIFQQSRGLLVDGIAGPDTLSALQGVTPAPIAPAPPIEPPLATGLQPGSRGTEVAQLQSQLSALGFYNAEITGYYGPLTEAAVREFQRSRGLPVTGVAGQSTLVALRGTTPDRVNPPTDTALQPGSSSAAVAQLQSRLAALGFYSGPVTGYYDTLTTAAVRDFQRSRGLPITGIATASTLSALQSTVVASDNVRRDSSWYL
jgi:peptidoglycan hydrolase-like protein with peptidoglycan-binding domain